MKTFLLSAILFMSQIETAYADMYMHMPRGGGGTSSNSNVVQQLEDNGPCYTQEVAVCSLVAHTQQGRTYCAQTRRELRTICEPINL